MQSKLSPDDKLALEQQLVDAEKKLEDARESYHFFPDKTHFHAVVRQIFRVMVYRQMLDLEFDVDWQMDRAFNYKPRIH